MYTLLILFLVLTILGNCCSYCHATDCQEFHVTEQCDEVANIEYDEVRCCHQYKSYPIFHITDLLNQFVVRFHKLREYFLELLILWSFLIEWTTNW